MNNASIAFIILTWNSERYIDKCLKSIIKLPFRDISVFIVDNGSKDNTLHIIGKYKKDDSRINVITLENNEGTTKTRNMALRSIVSPVDYICIIDSDTEVNESAFERMISILVHDQNESIGIVGPRMHNRNGEYQLSGRNLPTASIKLLKAFPLSSMKAKGEKQEIPSTPVIDHLQDVGYLLSACWLMPFSTLKTVGYLDENIFYAPEDVDYCVRVHQAGLRVVFCDSANILHDYQRISQKRLISKTNIKHVAGLIYYFNKYRYLFNSYKIYNDSSH